MTNQEMVARGLGTVAPTGSNITGEQIGNGIGTILNTAASTLNDVYGNYINAQIAGANMANSASAAAQKQQYLYNKEFMDIQNLQQQEYLKRMMDFNTQSAKEANDFTEKMWNKAAEYNQNIFNLQNRFNQEMWQKSADYNSAEAKAQREWQEQMSATAYQRAIKDMKAAGINPILAAQNGGANVGSGATASIGGVSSGSASMGATSGAQASGVNANAAGGSVGNYSGQAYHLSDSMAIFGAILGTLGEALTGMQANNFFGKAGTAIKDALDNTGQAIKQVVEGATELSKNNSEALHEYNNEYGSNFWEWITARNHKYWTGKDLHTHGNGHAF